MENYIFPGQNDCGCNDPISENCDNCSEDLGCAHPMDFTCLTYNGAALPCINVESGDKGDEILVKINTAICNIDAGNVDYSTYNTYCLAPITTQQEFVETISDQFCTLKAGYEQFTDITYEGDMQIINVRLDALEGPAMVSFGCLSVQSEDSLVEVISKTIGGVEDLCVYTSITGVNWNLCMTVTPTPTNIEEGFQAVLNQICNLSTQIGNINNNTFTVKSNPADTAPATLNEKLSVTSCLTKNLVTESGVSKVQIGLNFTPSIYTFNAAHFDVSPTGNNGCANTYTVSLDPDVITGGGVNCETMNAIYQPDPDAAARYFNGTDASENCYAFSICQVRKALFGEFAAGTYNIVIDPFAEDICDQYTLVEATPSTPGVTEVALTVPTSVLTVSGSPITSTGTFAMSLVPQNANYLLMGPAVGGATAPTFRAMVTADISNGIVTYGKIQPVTAKRLLGNYTNSTGSTQEITIGSGLTLTNGGVLQTSGIAAGTPLIVPSAGWSYVLEAGSNDKFGVITLTAPALSGSSSASAVSVEYSVPFTTIAVVNVTLESTVASVGTYRSAVLHGSDLIKFTVDIVKDNILLGDVFKVHYQVMGY